MSHNNYPVLGFFIGPTNAGKSSILEAVRRKGNPIISFIEVGKLLRAKYLDPASPHYQPDFFKGQAAPKHTEEEAYRLMADGIVAASAVGKRVVLIDGQPRSLGQLRRILTDYEDYPVRVFDVFCDREERERRAVARDGHNPDKLALSLARMDGDVKDVYEIRYLLLRAGIVPKVLDTGLAGFCAETAADLVQNICCGRPG